MQKSNRLAASLAIAAAGLILSTNAVATGGNRFTSVTELSGAQEVPSNDSHGNARALIRFDRDFSYADVRVWFGNLQGGVTRLHIHCNVAGANGPIAIGLIDTIAPENDNSDVITLAGQRIFGRITNADFPDVDSCLDTVGRPINNIVSLAAAIDAGLVYWNLHTTVFLPGELRGQVRPLESGDHYDD